MVMTCCVSYCVNTFATNRNAQPSRKSISFYRFPKIRARFCQKYQKLIRLQRLAWLAALRRGELSEEKLDGLRICSEHFASGIPSDFRDTDNPDWVPHLNMGYETNDSDDEDDGYEHDIEVKVELDYDLGEYNVNEENSVEVKAEPIYEYNSSAEVQTDPIKVNSVDIQTELSNSMITAIEAELLRRTEEVYKLRKHLAEFSLKEEAFLNDDEKLKYFTGLPSLQLFNLILSQLEPALSKMKIKDLDNFQKLLLTLMKLRFNTPFKGLAYRFQITLNDASNCFRKVIVLISHTFQGFVHWPDRDALQTAMPQSFREAFGNSIAVILDCFEIQIQRPASAKARAKTFSHYKHNFTAKYLVGITPHGFVSFISDGWEGRASGRHISEHSDLLDNLLPGDIVMSDRGFTIKESVTMDYAELLNPEFLHNKMQLAPEAVEKTRKIASVQIHVERIIGVMKNKFTILKGPIATNFLKFEFNEKSILDYIVHCACILTNLCDSIVPMEEDHKKNENVNVLLNEYLLTD